MRGKLRRPFREHYAVLTNTLSLRGCRVRDFMVVGFTTNRTISAYHRELQHYVIRCVLNWLDWINFQLVLVCTFASLELED
jgi:hypothetical protein